MADPKTEPKPAPAEPVYGAQVQKTLGKAKRSPDDQAEFFYNLRNTHIVFFLSSLGLLFSCVIMVWDDSFGATKGFNRDWKIYQRTYGQLDFGKLQAEIARLEEELKGNSGRLGTLQSSIERWERDLADPAKMHSRTIKVVDARVDAVKKEAAERGWKAEALPPSEEDKARRLTPVSVEGVALPRVAELKDKLGAEHYGKQQMLNFDNSDKMTIRSQFERAEQLYREAPPEKREEREREYKTQLERWTAILETCRKSKEAFDAVDARMSLYDDLVLELKRPMNDDAAAAARLRKEYEEKIRRYKSEKPQPANEIRNAPMMDFFDPSIKINQVILDNVLEDFHFAKIGRVERCHTCHKGIGNPLFEVHIDRAAEKEVDRYRFKDAFLASYVDHARDAVKKEECGVCKMGTEGKLIVQIAHGSWGSDDAIKYTKGLMAHPNLDLYVAGSSPHALDKVGCTVCHEGDGRDTEFSRAVHIPSSEEQEKAWGPRHHYHYRELWDRPMLPLKHVYASCRRCHTGAVELRGADEYVKGMQLYERAGCYACHRTDTYQILPKDTDGAKLDPNRKARRPGPPLTHVADKFTPEWMAKWVLHPKDFRLATRMPRFFGQSNARTIQVSDALATALAGEKARGATYEPKAVEDAVAATLTEYVFATSQTRSYDAPPGLKGDAARGKAVFEQIGCRACHTAAPEGDYARRTKDVRNDDDVYRAPEGTSWYMQEFAPNLNAIGTKLGAGTPHEARGRNWLYRWMKDPEHYFEQTRMPKMRPQDQREMTDQELMDLVEYLMGLTKPEWERGGLAVPPAPDGLVDYLIYEQLRLKMPDVDALDELREMRKTPQAKRLWFGRKMVQNFGCYSCHEMKPEAKSDLGRLNSRIEIEIDWTNQEGIGVELTGAQPEGIKGVDRLDYGHTHLDHLGNFKGVSFKHGFTGKPYHQVDPANQEPHIVGVHHTRWDWIRNKLLDPRVYDAGKLASKPPDELLRMPNFYFNAEETRLLTTFVLSFTDHDFPSGLVDQVKKRMSPDEQSLARGERLIRENNCRACHRLQLDRFEVEHTREVTRGEKKKEVTNWYWLEGRVKKDLPRADVDAMMKAWGFAESPKARVLSIGFTTDARTMRHEPGDRMDQGVPVKDKPVVGPQTQFVAYDGREWWLIDGTAAALAKKRLIRNWIPQEGGDIIPTITAYKSAHAADLGFDPKDAGQYENRVPPMLRTQGIKTQAEWFFDFLKSPTPIRPALRMGRDLPPAHKAFDQGADDAFQEVGDDTLDDPFQALKEAAAKLPAGPAKEAVDKLIAAHVKKDGKTLENLIRACRDAVRVQELNVRMPTFGFKDEEAASIVKYFWARDHEVGRNPYPYTHMKERDPAYLETRKAALEDAKVKVVFDTKACANCHFLNGRPPGTSNIASMGPDLAELERRLRPVWFMPWITNPDEVYPGTTMTNWTYDSDDQRRATMEYLMNFHRLNKP